MSGASSPIAEVTAEQGHARVIFAASLGTGFEWYDFFLYGSLAAVISRQFFTDLNEISGFIFALLTFAAGFAVRPFGALFFGRLGDRCTCGPMAAWLVELFPARVRYTSLSVPYHIGAGWFGGFLPAVAFALVAITGDIYSGIWYPVVVVTVTVIAGTCWLPETAGRAR